jgi:hypothetical protein
MKSSTASFSGGFSNSKYLGNPADPKARQFSSTSPGYDDDVNIADAHGGPTADIYMVPDFQGASGQGANQSTMRPIGSV